MEEGFLKDEPHRHLEKLQYCDALDACLIALLNLNIQVEMVGG
jgi:hypothetical protein